MLLIDGVKYELWIPPSEDEFERVVKEHAQDIFGEQSIYFDIKPKLKSEAGIGSKPDGCVIIFGANPQCHIIEIELSSHSLEHIVSQVNRLINGVRSPRTQREIVDAINDKINRDDFLKLKVKKATEPIEIHKLLTDLISSSPLLTIIIEKEKEGLREALNTFNYSPIEIVEFKTFTREGIGLAVHAHLFEPLYKPVTRIEPQPPPSPIALGNLVEIVLRPWNIKFYKIRIPTAREDLFPNVKTRLEFETDVGVIEPTFNPDWQEIWLGKWFEAHPELKAGDKLVIEVIEPMKKYRLEIVKEQKEGGWRPIRLSGGEVVN